MRNNNYGALLSAITGAALSVNNVFQNNAVNGIYCLSSPGVQIANQTLTGHTSPTGAIRIADCNNFRIGTGNTITGNTWAVTMDFASYPDAASAGNIPAAGNTNNDGLNCEGGGTGAVELWRPLGVPYVLTGACSIGSTGSLTIDPGCTVKFDAGTGLTVGGTLDANGTAGQPILMTRRDAGEAWTGLAYGAASHGTLAYCTIEYASYYAATAAVRGDGYWPAVEHCTLRNNNYGALLSAITGAALSVNNVFQNNAVNGIYCLSSPGVQIANQTLTGHTSPTGAIRIADCNNFRIGTGNTITGNTWAVTMDFASYPDAASAGNIPAAGNTNNDGLNCEGGGTGAVELWRPLGVPYVLTGACSIGSAGSLTIHPGCTVKFDAGTGLTVGGTLDANGTAGQPILMTRRDAGEAWTGLAYSATAHGTLAYCTIEYASYFAATAAVRGDGYWPALEHCTLRNNNYGALLSAITGAALSVNNVFQNNAANGIYCLSSPGVQIANQTLTGHTSPTGAIRIADCNNFRIGAGNSITGNTWAVTMDFASYPDAASAGNIPAAGNTNNDGLNCEGGSTGAVELWRPLGVPYVLTGACSIGSTGSLTIHPGCTVKFDAGTGLTVGGTLDASGTPGQPILMTRRDAGEAWTGLAYGATAHGTLAYCTIEYASYFSSSAGVNAVNAADVTISACILQNNNYGVLASSASPRIITSRIVNNLQYGVYLSGACAPTFGGSLAEWNDIFGNGSGNLNRDLVNGTQDIAARYVNWGTTAASGIEQRIQHDPDDASLGVVYYSPWTDLGHAALYGGPVPVEEPQVALPTAYALDQNYPNPFNPATVIAYALPHASHVSLVVYDIAGRRVATLLDEDQPAGFKTIRWDPRDLPSGVYVYRLNADDYTQTRRMMLVR